MSIQFQQFGLDFFDKIIDFSEKQHIKLADAIDKEEKKLYTESVNKKTPRQRRRVKNSMEEER